MINYQRLTSFLFFIIIGITIVYFFDFPWEKKQQKEVPKPEVLTKTKITNLDYYDVREIDGCEYLAYNNAGTFALTHKGNCKLCIQRNLQNKIIK